MLQAFVKLLDLNIERISMSDLVKAVEQISNVFNTDVNNINVSPHKTDVWGNALYKIITPNNHFLYKEFHSFAVVDIMYNPPKVSPENRLKTSVIMQKLVSNAIRVTNIKISKIRFKFTRSFVMDYLDNSLDLK